MGKLSQKYNKKLNILFYFGGFSEIGGIEIFTVNLIKELSKFPVYISILNWGKYNSLLKEIEKMNNIKIHRSFWRWGCRYGIPDIIILSRGIKLLRKSDIIIFGKLFSPYIMFRLYNEKRKNNKIKFIFITPYRPLEMFHEYSKFHNYKNIKKIINIFDSIIVQSHIFKKDLIKFGFKNKIYIIPYITKTTEEKIKPFPDDKIIKIGFLGRLVKDKNVSYLIESLKSLLTEYRNKKIELHIFGNGKLKKELKELSKNLKIEEHIKFHGIIHPDKVYKAIDSCHMFVFPSITEGQCLAAVEVISRGRIVLGTPVGALPDIISDKTGEIIPLNNKEKLKEILIDNIKKIIKKEYNAFEIRKYFEKKYAPSTLIEKYWKVFNKN